MKLCARREQYAFSRQVCLNQALFEGGIEYLEELEALPEPSKIKCTCPECTAQTGDEKKEP